MTENQNIFTQIPKVMGDIGAVTKDRKNEQQRYSFRGIEDFYQAAHPAMVRHGIFCVPKVLEREVYRFEKTNDQGRTTTWLHVALKVEHHFFASDGSTLPVPVTTWGEGLDNSDKATNKAMSGAMKYALIELFCVPTKDIEDSDRSSPENGKRRQLVEQEVVLGAPEAPKDYGGTVVLNNTKLEESALERKLRESLEMLGAPKIGGPDKSVSAESNGPAKPADTNGYISLDDQRAIHIHAKSFVSKKHEKFARTWVHDFLVTKGVVDENGEGTLTKLKKFYFKDGQQLSNINRIREALEPYMKQRDADKLAEETQAI